MDEDQLVRQLPALLQQYWRFGATLVDRLGGGMNSATALVVREQHSWVAKWVPSPSRPSFALGLEVAARLAAGGLRSGRPLPTVDGVPMIGIDGGWLALLEFVPGRELTTDPADQPGMASALALAHALLGTSRRRKASLPELGDDHRLAEVADWILPAVDAVRAEYRGLPALTWGLLHGDPAPEAFRKDPVTGDVGMIDWTGASDGPLLYDVASALMYLGGPDRADTFVRQYRAQAPIPADEFDHLDTLRRLRGVVQADYFGRRILNDDLTGIDDPKENRKGLTDARQMLHALGVLG